MILMSAIYNINYMICFVSSCDVIKSSHNKSFVKCFALFLTMHDTIL